MSAEGLRVKYDPEWGAWGVFDPSGRVWRGHSPTEAGAHALRRNIVKWAVFSPGPVC